jgi:hypothetical protein
LLRLLRESFNPFELGCVAVLFPPLGLVCGTALTLATGRVADVVIAVTGAVLASIPFHLAAACPACSKSPLRFYYTQRGVSRGGEPFGRRMWPERECSHCRTPLDIP